jgi:hypothetical protein
MAKGRGVFSDEVAGDIDDLLPSQLPPPPPVEDDGDQPALPPAVRAPAVPRRRTAAASVPTVQVDSTVHKKLRSLTTKERARNPVTARSYTQVVLDAIEAHQDQLADMWARSDEQPATHGLFSRQRVTTSPHRRRRHAEPPARIPLAGLNPDDSAAIDQLVVDWNAGSRSALVEEALRLYLN